MPKQTFFNLPEEKRNTIIDIAINEFAQNDYESASISRLVAKAGIAKGSFYQYFEDKMDLYRYLFDLMAQRKAELLNTEPPDPQMGIFAFIRWLAEIGVAFEVEHPRLSRIGYRAVSQNNLPDTFVTQAQEQSDQFFKQLLAQGKAQGDVAADIDDDLAAFIFNAIFNGLGQYMFDRVTAVGKNQPEEVASFFELDEVKAIFDQTLRILEHGIGNRD
jgi:TetR/AcrR family transcriptional regulator